MKQIKVSEATPIQLDWLVAKSEGKNGVLHDDGITRCIVIAAPSGVYKGTYKPSINWSQGGPIIERECITLDWAHRMEWFATLYVPDEEPWRFSGPTPLIAACRCFVASKLGETAEVPEELV